MSYNFLQTHYNSIVLNIMESSFIGERHLSGKTSFRITCIYCYWLFSPMTNYIITNYCHSIMTFIIYINLIVNVGAISFILMQVNFSYLNFKRFTIYEICRVISLVFVSPLEYFKSKKNQSLWKRY